MKRTTVIGAACLLVCRANADVPVLRPPPLPAPADPVIMCQATRVPWSPAIEQRFAYVVIATVVSAPRISGQTIRAEMHVDHFIKGRFKPTTIELVFDTACGAGGSQFYVGDQLKLDLMLVRMTDGGFIGLVGYWH